MSTELGLSSDWPLTLVASTGVNTKQLSNQMLELTKVINELKDVLIQQVTAAKTHWGAIKH